MGKADEHHLRGHQRVWGARDLFKALEQHLPGARQNRHGQLAGKLEATGTFLLGHGGVVCQGRRHLELGHPVGEAGKVGQYLFRVGSIGELLFQFIKSLAGIALHQGFKQVDDAGAVSQAQHRLDIRGAHRIGAIGNGLVKQRQPVTDGTFSRTCDHAQGLVFSCHVLAFAHPGEVLHQLDSIETAQVEALATRQHSDRNFPDLGGGEDELHVWRRLFQRLQQRVERRRGEHVHFVDDVDLVAGRSRLVLHRIVDLPHIVDAGVGGCVHLDDVDMARLENGVAVPALDTKVDRRTRVLTVDGHIIEGAGNQAGRRRLADAAYAGKHVGLGDTIGCERVGERSHHGVLTDQVLEGLRAVLAREHPVGSLRFHCC